MKDKDLKMKMQNPLLAMRLGVALVLIMWTLDKFINTAHALKVYESFYFLSVPSNAIIVFGIIELIIIALFLAGRFKNFTYAFVLVIHAVSTLSTMKIYFSPFEGSNLLFFAAWPMLAACYALYILRHEDTKFNI